MKPPADGVAGVATRDRRSVGTAGRGSRPAREAIACTVADGQSHAGLQRPAVHPGHHLSQWGRTRMACGLRRRDRSCRLHSTPHAPESELRRTYVIDTSVLLSDPHALRRFAEHDVVLAGRGDHRAGGQAAPRRARLLRPDRAAPPRRPADHVRPARRAGPGQRRGWHRPRRAQPHRSRACCRPASGSATTTRGSSPSR